MEARLVVTPVLNRCVLHFRYLTRRMRAVIQRVISAAVTVNGETISSIGKGLLVLVGIDRNDTPSDSDFIIKKILSAKVFDDETGSSWKRSVQDINGEVLCVSQFTLLAAFKGAKPDFHESMSTIPGKAFYTSFIESIKTTYDPSKIKDGQFGAMMQVALVNDGPVTILLDSHEKRSKSSNPSGSSTPLPTSASTSQTPLDVRIAAAEDSRRVAAKKAEEKRRRTVELSMRAEANAEKHRGGRRFSAGAERRNISTSGVDGREATNGAVEQVLRSEEVDDMNRLEEKLADVRVE